MKKLCLGLAVTAALATSAVALAAGTPSVRFVTPKPGASITFTVRLTNPASCRSSASAKPARVSYLCTFHPTLMRGRIDVIR